MKASASRWRPHVRLSFGVKINFILCLGMAILVAVGTLAYRSVDELVQTGRREGLAFSDLGHLEVAIASLRRAESAQRKYLITGSTRDLAGYREDRAQSGAIAAALRSYGGEEEQQRRMLELGHAIGERLDVLDRVVDVRTRRGLQAATELVGSQRVAELEQRIEALTEQFRRQSSRAVRNQQQDTAFSADTTSFLTSWGTAFAVMLLLWAMVVIHRYQAGREAAEQALRSSEAQLRLITDAVPAFIGYVDRGGRLQFHNRAFERWLGRGTDEIRGRALRELLGADTYDRIEPHIEQVLGGTAVRFDFVLPRAAGRNVDVSAQLVPRLDAQGRVAGYYALATDVSALKEVDRLKSEFVSTVSHELRTPLTSIRGSLGLIAGGVTGALPEKTAQLVSIAMNNCERLVRLINDILDSEKMMAGKMELSLEKIDLASLAQRAIRENEAFSAAHGARIVLAAQTDLPRVQGDSDRLLQVLTNLLSNASKFSPRGGEIELRLAAIGQGVRLSVSDRGPGVPADLQGRLFERFAQLDSADARRREGTGLGLSICRGIIDRLGGQIGFEPREGGGSTFYFVLPALHS